MAVKFNDILDTLYARRILILVVCGIVFVGSAIIVLLQPNFYRAVTVFYAASEDMSKPEHIYGLSNNEMSYYGSDLETDRLISAGKSEQFGLLMVDSFDLYRHYEIDPERDLARERVLRRFFKLYELRKNERDALELSIEATDPERAADMANGARKILDHMAANFIKESQRDLYENLKNSIVQREQLLDSVIADIQALKREFRIVDTETQSEQLAEALTKIQAGILQSKSKLEAFRGSPDTRSIRDSIRKAELLLSSRKNQLRMMQSDTGTVLSLGRFREGKEKVESLETYFLNLKSQLSKDRLRLKNVRGTIDAKTPALIVVQEAGVPQKKYRPRRSLIVLAATAVAFLFTVLGILLFESVRELDWKPKES